MDPINALQNLASQGTRNPMPQMMNLSNQMVMGGGNANPNVLQNLMHVSYSPGIRESAEFFGGNSWTHSTYFQQRANQPQPMQMGNIQGIRNQMPNMMPNARVNAMQQVNMAAAGMNPNAIRASMQGGNMNAMPNINVMASQAMQASNMGNVMQNTMGNMQQGNMPAGSINVANITMGEYCAGVKAV